MRRTVASEIPVAFAIARPDKPLEAISSRDSTVGVEVSIAREARRTRSRERGTHRALEPGERQSGRSDRTGSTTASKALRFAAIISRSRAGRRSFEPETPSSMYCSTSFQPRTASPRRGLSLSGRPIWAGPCSTSQARSPSSNERSSVNESRCGLNSRCSATDLS
jgi:hypothetical protein